MSNIPGPEEPVLLFAEECDPGILLHENQDAVLHARVPMGDLLVVADGIGGYIGGATSSQMVVKHFREHLTRLPAEYPAKLAIREAAEIANAKILAAPREPGTVNVRMGSTVVAAVLQEGDDGPVAWIGHVGDSRAYLWRVGRLYRLTIDHSAVQSMLSRKLITPEEAEHHPDIPVLTRSLGRLPEVEIDIERHPLAVGDTLLFCSDGLWGFVPEHEIEKAAGGPSLEAAAQKLLELALATGGHDNIAIEMARLIQPPALPPPSGLPAAFRLILTLFLLAILGLCILAYFVL
ncbi:MAG: protein phosphatase 2C domain-containing protein [Terracidiphilus sp.]|jgi:protein phosphatase